ncbi:hypothetical protein [Mycolicibacterium sp. XJ1819]
MLNPATPIRSESIAGFDATIIFLPRFCCQRSRGGEKKAEMCAVCWLGSYLISKPDITSIGGQYLLEAGRHPDLPLVPFGPQRWLRHTGGQTCRKLDRPHG